MALGAKANAGTFDVVEFPDSPKVTRAVKVPKAKYLAADDTKIRDNIEALWSLVEKFKCIELLTGPDLSFIMEAHNGLSARIVQEAGFKAMLILVGGKWQI